MKIGDKVVCIDDCGKSKWGPVCDRLGYKCTWPVKDEIYTIRNIRHDGFSIVLEEIVNPLWEFRETFTGKVVYAEAHFHVRHFRLVDYTFGEKVISEINEQIEKEVQPQLV